MSRHDDTISLRQMYDHSAEAIKMANGRMRSDLDSDRQFALAMLKLVEIVGEAANRISPSYRQAYPAIPWDQIVATRNPLIHGYDSVDLNILWRIVSDDLPSLTKQLTKILNQ